ncbi:tetratricopeptide repeat protein [Oceanirhabdus sp. W0125-5]|uniref:tetratricopeptide repeat protein n=1 Tax=Oceanirhabdus sp. W0125-5 TaxID=2999116 RepID=UPI0022F335D0|nr:hypothetical protein [Oceanirhabdus sp. W0125-5]WBW96838.1 hypothetical protein OW730_24580 [Oceanirhabdus sp. W0125-5]
MLIKRGVLVASTAITMLVLVILGVDLPLAGIITFIAIITAYMSISIKRTKDRLSLLNDKCDPEAFLDRTEKQREITGKKPKLNAYLNVDKAAALCCMGKVEEAKSILIDMDKGILSRKNGALLIYTINYILCLYDLGEIEEADKLYETEFINLLQDCILSDKPRFKRRIKFLVAEREFIHGKYEESKKKFEELYEEGFSKRHRIAALHGLARINEKLGAREKAIEQYTKIVELGNKLYIVEEAKEKLKELK